MRARSTSTCVGKGFLIAGLSLLQPKRHNETHWLEAYARQIAAKNKTWIFNDERKHGDPFPRARAGSSSVQSLNRADCFLRLGSGPSRSYGTAVQAGRCSPLARAVQETRLDHHSGLFRPSTLHLCKRIAAILEVPARRARGWAVRTSPKPSRACWPLLAVARISLPHHCKQC